MPGIKQKRKTILILALVLGVAVIFGGKYYQDQRRAAWDSEVIGNYAATYTNLEKERLLAAKYWARYPGVGVHSYFGKKGRLKIFGARAHFDRHGKGEGNVWPKLEK
jgi:hypothetical protein